MRIKNFALAAISGGIAAACVTVPIQGDPATPVFALGETSPVGTRNEDAADDPAIWRNANDPSKSLIVATDKKGGLYVYGLDGKVRHFVARPALNNVDLVEMGGGEVIVFASDRSDLAKARIALFKLDTATGSLSDIGAVRSGSGEAYGICGWLRDGRLIVYTAPKEGNIGEWEIALQATAASPAPSARQVRSMQVPSQPEGCVVDTRNGDLFVGEEAAGIWRFPAGKTEGELVAPVDNKMLVADVEGLALAPSGETGGYLVASSQGDNAYAVFNLPDMKPVGRFRIAEGSFGATEETDGIALDTRGFGAGLEGGLFIAQDGVNPPHTQNFKLVSWGAIKVALGLD